MVAIVAAQEFQWVFCRQEDRSRKPGVWFDFVQGGAPGRHLLLLHPRPPSSGPGFIKICTYFPYPAKVWLQRPRVGQAPGRPGADRLHRAGQRLRLLRRTRAPPGDLRPLRPRRHPGLLRPLDRRDPHPVHRRRPDGRLLLGALHAPGRGVPHPRLRRSPPGPGFFESLVADNVGIGRPDEVAVVFARQVRKTTKEPFAHPDLHRRAPR